MRELPTVDPGGLQLMQRPQTLPSSLAGIRSRLASVVAACLLPFGTVSGLAQCIQFSNAFLPGRAVIDRETGSTVDDVQFVAQSYWGPAGTRNPSSLAPLGAFTHLIGQGIFVGGPRCVPVEVTQGSMPVFAFQVRVWDSNFGATYEDSLAHPAVKRGSSNIFDARTYTLGDDVPTGLDGLGRIAIGTVPEPTPSVLLGIGVALLITRRPRPAR